MKTPAQLPDGLLCAGALRVQTTHDFLADDSTLPFAATGPAGLEIAP